MSVCLCASVLCIVSISMSLPNKLLIGLLLCKGFWQIISISTDNRLDIVKTLFLHHHGSRAYLLYA